MANGSWGSGTPLAQPFVIEKFEWQGDEDSLAAMAEDQERLRAIQETQDLKEEPK
jgi:hypothetical protein